MSLIVKICGLSTPTTLDAALEAGADMVGFVFFPPSPRHLDLAHARELGAQVGGRAGKVALTVDADDATLANIVDAVRPDLLQLHGKETVARIRDIKRTFGRLLENLVLGIPFMLSGGLTVNNISEAARITRTGGVDVSSGVESAPGVKDVEMIRDFIRAARAAEAGLREAVSNVG